MTTDPLPTLDLFTGAGGLTIGLGHAGLVPVGASEMDRDALRTFRAAHERYFSESDLTMFEGDIAKHSFRDFRGEVAVVAGGPPCQPYSMGGARRGSLDERDGIPQFIRVVDEVAPEAFIMENVPGLARGSMAPILSSAVAELADLGFSVSWRVLHAADYGVAQRRQRLFIVGTRSGEFTWPSPTHGTATTPRKTARDVLDPSAPIGTPNLARVTFARRPDLRPSPFDGHLWNGGGRPIDLDGLVPTLLASMGGNKTPWFDLGDVVREYHQSLMAGGQPRVGVVPGARRLTAAEAALIQGFPADMPWHGPTSSKYRQVGNAVPVALAEAVGVSVRAHLDSSGAHRNHDRMLVA